VVDLLLSLGALLGLAAAALAVLAGLTLAPFVVAVTVAERSSRDTFRWGAVAAGCALGGSAGALLALRAGRSPTTVALAAATCWAGPALLAARTARTDRSSAVLR